MGAVDDSGLAEKLDRYRQVAAEIEARLGEVADRLVGPVTEAFDFLSEVESLVAPLESDSSYADALERSGARGLLDRLEDLRALARPR